MTVAGMAGAGIIGASVAKQVATERSAAALANKAFRTPGETRSRQQIQRSLLTQAEAVGGRTGNRAGVIEAIDKFVAISGSLRGGQAMAGFMADVSDATGAEMGDVGRTGGQILQNIAATRGLDLSNAKDFEEAMAATRDIMASMAGQAKVGSIEFADLATQMGKVMSSTARFEGDVSDLANQMGAIAQLAIAGGAASPEEAMTSIMRFSDDLIQNAHRFDKLARTAGIESGFFTDEGKTKLRDPTEIMMDMMRVTRGDLTKAKKVFGIRAMKAMEPFQQAFVQAGGQKDVESGLRALRAQLERFKGAGMTREEIQKSATFSREQRGRKMQIVWEDLMMKMGKEFAPVLDDLLPTLVELGQTFKQLAPYLSGFLKALAKNPLMMGGALLGGRMALGALGGMGQGMMMGGGMRAGMGAIGGGMGAAGVVPVNVMNAQAMGTSMGGALMAAGLGAAIGSAVAAGITIYGISEIERREAETSDIMKQATLGDAAEAKKRAGKALAAIEQRNERKREVRSAVRKTMRTSMGAGMGIGDIAGANLLFGEQEEMDVRTLTAAEKTAEMRQNMKRFDEEFALSAGEGVTALDGFYKKLNEFQPPKESPNRGDQPSPVK
jgi:hypothetical protein